MAGNWMFMDLAGSQDQTPPEKQLRKLKDDLQLFARQVRYELYHLTEKNFVEGVLESGTVSDKRRKSGIRYDLERYTEFYRKIRPCAFRYKGREVEGYHIGVIAQDTEKAALEAGLDRKDVAAVYLAPGEEYRVRYEELAALNLWMIQRLTERVEKLEEAIRKDAAGDEPPPYGEDQGPQEKAKKGKRGKT